MRGYSKMNLTSKSSSMDSSELNKSKEEDQNSKMEMKKDNKNEMVLKRNMSCSSSYSSSQRIRRGPDVLKRAFSMRRSSSVADGYCRIHDTTEYDDDDDDDDEDVVLDDDEQQQQQQQKDMKRSSRKKGSKFFRACKSLFKF